jgi:hypothetical protein
MVNPGVLLTFRRTDSRLFPGQMIGENVPIAPAKAIWWYHPAP